MKNTFVLLCLLFATIFGCGTKETITIEKEVLRNEGRAEQDPTFEEQIKYFEYLVGEKMLNTVISFDLPEGRDYEMFNERTGRNIAGVCFPDINHVTINVTEWANFGPLQQYQLIAHELLHCAFRIGHRSDKFAIMNTRIHSEYDLQEVWRSLITEVREYQSGQDLGPLTLSSLLPITLAAGKISDSDHSTIKSFCKINTHGPADTDCILTVRNCVKYVPVGQCIKEYTMNRGYVMGTCPDPELIRSLAKSRGIL